jgi:hypothetical protein
MSSYISRKEIFRINNIYQTNAVNQTFCSYLPITSKSVFRRLRNVFLMYFLIVGSLENSLQSLYLFVSCRKETEANCIHMRRILNPHAQHSDHPAN